MNDSLVIGLTGGIGSGKSAAADRFAELGASVVDTDVISHMLTGPGGAAMAAIRQSFGADVIAPSGALDRAAMRERVFSDSAARSQLESILHPLIRAESERQTAAATGDYVVLVVPLLIESQAYRQRCHRIAVVDCPESLQIERVVKRSQLSEQQVKAIIAAQTSREVRLAAAHDIIDNSLDFDSLRDQIDKLHTFYLELIGRRGAGTS